MIDLSEVNKYIEEELFSTLYVLHPYFAVNGRIEPDKMAELKESGLQVVLVTDRNVFSEIVAAVKRGTFAGANRKKITAFIIWSAINKFNISPYDGIKEYAMAKNDNISGNRELELFYYLFENIPIEIVIKSFYSDEITFRGKKYNETKESGISNFMVEEPSFLFLYATILHLVYVLNKYTKPDEQFEEFFKWYFNECLISEYAIAYSILYLSQSGVKSPHHYKDSNIETVIKGCSNQARDLQYLQDINPDRYPSDEYILMCVTNENDMRKVFELVNDRTRYYDIDSYLKVLCSCFPMNRREEKYTFIKDIWNQRKNLEVNPNNALNVAKELASKEEKRLRDLFETSDL